MQTSTDERSGLSMSEDDLVNIVRDFSNAYVNQDVEKTLAFLTEDVTWVAPEGTFEGKDEVRRLLTWIPHSFWWRKLKFTEAGLGILVKENKAVYEYVIEGIGETGVRYQVAAVSIFEFRGEKIQKHRTVYDRMTVGKQACKGLLDRQILMGILNTWEKGLH